MTDRFRPGQTVRLTRGFPYKAAAEGDYKIVCRVPDSEGELQYRVKSAREPHERVMKESELAKA
jgi:hypothetical protein